MSEEIDDECDDTEDIMSATQEMIDNITYRNCELHDENDKLKAEVERLRAVFHAAEGVLSGLEYLPLEHGSLLHRTLKETVYEYRKFMDKRKEGGA